jgi:FHA domain
VSDLRITFAGQTFTFEPGQTIRIGRSPDNAVVVSDPIVSRDHARISWQPDGWILDDLGKGRTFIGGLPVASVSVQQPLDVHLATPLGPGLRIELAGADEEADQDDQDDQDDQERRPRPSSPFSRCTQMRIYSSCPGDACTDVEGSCSLPTTSGASGRKEAPSPQRTATVAMW